MQYLCGIDTYLFGTQCCDGQSSEQDIDEVEPEAQEEDAEQQLGNYK